MSPLRHRLRDVVDPVAQEQRERPLRNGVVLLALIGLAVYMAVAQNIPLINGKPGERLRADFAFTNQVIPNQTPVRVGGVDVGQVDAVGAGADPRRVSRVEMRITDDDLVIRRDARAEIRWRTLLGGNMYIDLEPGSDDVPELGDGVIPADRTGSQVELDDVLRPYDGGTEQAQRDVIAGLSDGLADAEATQEAIDSLRDLREVGEGLEPVQGTELGDLRKTVAATSRIVRSLGADTGALRRLVTGAQRTLRATDLERQALGAFLRESPPALDETRTTLVRVRSTLDRLDPLADELRPGARAIAPAVARTRPALLEADRLLGELRPLLRQLPPTFRDLQGFAQAGTPLLRDLEPVIETFRTKTLPFLDARDAQAGIKAYEAIGPTFSVLSMAAAEFDALGHRLHLSTPPANNSVLTAAPGGGGRRGR